VRQLFKQAGLPTLSLGERAKRKKEADRARASEVVATFRELRDEDAVAKRLGMPARTVRELVKTTYPPRSAEGARQAERGIRTKS
jgi:hypothetical protein